MTLAILFFLNDETESIKQSFQDGCNTLVSKCTELGVTPISNSPIDISNAIQTIANNQWSAGNTNGWSSGHTAGYNEGRTQGQQDVKNNPNGYGLYNQSQYDQNYNNGYNSGYNDGRLVAGAEFQVITWTMSNSAGNLSELRLTGFSDIPNYVSISAVNNVWMDMIYDARYSTTQVKYCAYSTSQTIAYENRSTRMPTFTKDRITVVPFVSGVGDKKATAVIARITNYNS